MAAMAPSFTLRYAGKQEGGFTVFEGFPLGNKARNPSILRGNGFYNGVKRRVAKPRLMAFKQVDHVAIAVPNLEAAVAPCKTFIHKDPEQITEVPDKKVKRGFFW